MFYTKKAEHKKCSVFFSYKLCKKVSYAVCNSLVLAISKEVFLESSSCDCAENKLTVEVLENVNEVGVCNLLNLVENSLVSLLRNCSLARVAKSPFGNKELFKNVLKVKFTAPAPALCERHRDSVAVINLSELICVCGIYNVTAKNSGE